MHKIYKISDLVLLYLNNFVDSSHTEWQREWESESNMNNKLKRILPKINENHTPKGINRRDGTVYARLRIGHLYFDSLLSPKGYISYYKGEPKPFCISCNEALTIYHLLTNCAEFADIRQKHYLSKHIRGSLRIGVLCPCSFLPQRNKPV